ncbi:unnamed protein product [Gongylonema pulchrum]|uniref:ATP-synt_DE_N domain-containing protein n=1 Tax=Gongylonema pulchrum TaxID=637853 RepID=A0A183EAZ8_9BILA|nr:unnamed protein product [Gongylonema pulchrum]
MPLLGAAYRNVIAILSSLNEITVFVESEKTPLATLEIELEPSVIGLGPKHVAIAMNNRAWFYEITEKTGKNCVNTASASRFLLSAPYANFVRAEILFFMRFFKS